MVFLNVWEEVFRALLYAIDALDFWGWTAAILMFVGYLAVALLKDSGHVFRPAKLPENASYKANFVNTEYQLSRIHKLVSKGERSRFIVVECENIRHCLVYITNKIELQREINMLVQFLIERRPSHIVIMSQKQEVQKDHIKRMLNKAAIHYIGNSCLNPQFYTVICMDEEFRPKELECQLGPSVQWKIYSFRNFRNLKDSYENIKSATRINARNLSS